MSSEPQSQKNVLLFGGHSEERLVSVASAQNLARKFHFNLLLFQNYAGQVYSLTLKELLAHEQAFTVEFKPTAATSLFAQGLEAALDRLTGATVFLGYHGSQGEDGHVQSLLEARGIAYTGSDSRSSAQSFDKLKAKQIMSKADVLMAESFTLHQAHAADPAVLLQLADFLKKYGRAAIKPAASGSSFGLQFISKAEQIPEAIKKIQSESYSEYIVEAFIAGRELTVGVLQRGDDLVALPASEVILNEGHSFDYQGKYLGIGTTEVTPAAITQDELKKAQQLALTAHRHLGCYGYSRTDMFLTPNGVYFLEINTLPGLSKASFIPQQLAAAGIEISDFVSEQMALARRRSGY